MGMTHRLPQRRSAGVSQAVQCRGDGGIFSFGDLSSLCRLRRDSAKQHADKSGWGSTADLSRYPVDPRHPALR